MLVPGCVLLVSYRCPWCRDRLRLLFESLTLLPLAVF